MASKCAALCGATQTKDGSTGPGYAAMILNRIVWRCVPAREVVVSGSTARFLAQPRDGWCGNGTRWAHDNGNPAKCKTCSRAERRVELQMEEAFRHCYNGVARARASAARLARSARRENASGNGASACLPRPGQRGFASGTAAARLPTLATLAELQASRWSHYYSELYGPSFLQRVEAADLPWDTTAAHMLDRGALAAAGLSGALTGAASSCKAYLSSCEGTPYSFSRTRGALWDPPNVTFLHHRGRRPLPSHAWVEVARCAATGRNRLLEEHSAWFYHTPGSGVYLNMCDCPRALSMPGPSSPPHRAGAHPVPKGPLESSPSRASCLAACAGVTRAPSARTPRRWRSSSATRRRAATSATASAGGWPRPGWRRGSTPYSSRSTMTCPAATWRSRLSTSTAGAAAPAPTRASGGAGARASPADATRARGPASPFTAAERHDHTRCTHEFI